MSKMANVGMRAVKLKNDRCAALIGKFLDKVVSEMNVSGWMSNQDQETESCWHSGSLRSPSWCTKREKVVNGYILNRCAFSLSPLYPRYALRSVAFASVDARARFARPRPLRAGLPSSVLTFAPAPLQGIGGNGR